MTTEHREIAIIGAGPAGAVAAALLRRAGHDVLVLERTRFPRFSIGESLLPRCMGVLERAGMLPAIQAAGFQPKNGAAFGWGVRYAEFDFRDKSSAGPAVTWQVQRARFDKILADEAERQGAEVRYGQEIVSAEAGHGGVRLRTLDAGPAAPGCAVSSHTVAARFVLDASGYGRVLARLLDLERPSGLPPRAAIYTHVEDNICDAGFDREKILISVHPSIPGVWYWLIPFSDGRSSIGVVGPSETIMPVHGLTPEAMLARLRDACGQAPNLQRLLRAARWDTPAGTLAGYAASVTRLHGPGFALLGNAAEFLDPVFSSGVTIALESAQHATSVLHRQSRGERVDWDEDFAVPLLRGVRTFRAFVQAWYDGALRDIVFFDQAQPDVRRMVSSILAGYAWDLDNPFVTQPERRLELLARLCRRSQDHEAATDGGRS
jgi:flavin-dependent dehydrogenase